jgi:CRP-like cAMP-binding protein
MLDIENLRRIYKFAKNLDLSDLQALLKFAKSSSFAPMEVLIRAGSSNREVFFIKKGLIRIYTVNDQGDDITIGIFHENQTFANIDSILFEQPSRFHYQAIEPTTTLSLDYDVIQTIVSKHPKLEANRKFVLLNFLKTSITRVESFVLQTPEERYVDFINKNRAIIHRIPDKYIANIIGITPVSLSRIRGRIAAKKGK